MKKTWSTLLIIGAIVNIFANDNNSVIIKTQLLDKTDSEFFKKTFEFKTQEAIKYHYQETISSNSLSEIKSNDKQEHEAYTILNATRLYDSLPIYKVEYKKLAYKNGLKNYIDTDYITVDNSKSIYSLSHSNRGTDEDFKFHKINNFTKLMEKCNKDEECYRVNIGVFNKIDNLSYEKIEF